jgi:hypothetical protein
MQEVSKIILGEKFQRHRRLVADLAEGRELTRGQVLDDVGEVEIVIHPQRDEVGPRGALHGLHADAAILIVTGKLERPLLGSPDKPLVIVGSGVD